MNYRKQGLRALGLAMLAVLGLMAFTASGAQASGSFLIEGLPTPWASTVAGTEDTPLDDKLLVLGLNMEIFCHDATASGLITNKGHGHAQIIFEKCLAQGVSGGALVGAVCEIPNITANTLALVILHASGSGNLTTAQHNQATGDPYILFTPLDGLTFAKVLNHTECALPENANVKGCVVADIITEGDQVVHLISTKGMLSLFGCKLMYGANEAHLDADAFVFLTDSAHGKHLNRKWGAV